MATETASKTYFRIKKCPGPFCLASGWMHLLENYDSRLIIDLTIYPDSTMGMELMGLRQPRDRGYDATLRISFEVTLMGSTNACATVMRDGPSGVRLLGRFRVDENLRDELALNASNRETAIEAELELAKWQWEVIFNPTYRHAGAIGFVNKLNAPLPDEWTR